jgi:hypothetical protein
MIVSVHVPKTAGTSFRALLHAAYGPRLFLDYGDWAGYTTPQAIAHRAVRRREMQGRCEHLIAHHDVIHGHFVADKYAELFPTTDFVAFFRDPYQQAISSYAYLLNNPHIDHPAVKIFHAEKMSLHEYVRWEATSNPQTQVLGSVPLSGFTFVGLTEELSRGVALFNSLFAQNLSVPGHENTNPARGPGDYSLWPDIRKAIEQHRAADIDLYARAKETFTRLARQRGG